jgi:hypothetical protein
MKANLVLGAVAATLLAACATAPSAPPRHASAAEYDALAAQEDLQAKLEESKFVPAAGEVIVERCGGGNAAVAGYAQTCWTEYKNPTRYHLDEAERHRARAADDRARSKGMRDAEARACAGIGDADRDMSPFHHREDILIVERLYEPGGAHGAKRLAGAVIFFRRVPGMTAAHLQAIVDCHIARNDALGHVSPSMPYCPLVPQNVEARVRDVRGGFAIAVRSDDAESVREIVERAEGLVP